MTVQIALFDGKQRDLLQSNASPDESVPPLPSIYACSASHYWWGKRRILLTED